MNFKKFKALEKEMKKKQLSECLDDEILELFNLVKNEYELRFSKRYYRYNVTPTEVQWLIEPYRGSVKNKDFHKYLVKLSKSKRAADKNKQISIYKSPFYFKEDKLLTVEELETEYQEQLLKSNSLSNVDSTFVQEKLEYKLLPLAI